MGNLLSNKYEFINIKCDYQYIVVNKQLVFYDVAHVRMKKLPKEQLKKLFGKHMDKAGSYAVQDKDDCFVKKIYGDYYTVVGMPYIKLKKELKKFKIVLK